MSKLLSKSSTKAQTETKNNSNLELKKLSNLQLINFEPRLWHFYALAFLLFGSFAVLGNSVDTFAQVNNYNPQLSTISNTNLNTNSNFNNISNNDLQNFFQNNFSQNLVNSQIQTQNSQNNKPETKSQNSEKDKNNNSNYQKETSEMLDLINKERTKNGIGILKTQKNLVEASSYFANYMAQKDVDGSFFEHTEKSGRTPWERCKDFGYPITCGENLAAGQLTVNQAFEDLMKSSSHRKNILNPKYCQIGISKAQNPDSYYGVYWVQNFGRNCE